MTTETLDNLLPAFLIARAFGHGWASNNVTNGRIPKSWGQARAWFNAAQEVERADYQRRHDDAHSAEVDRIARAGGDAWGVRVWVPGGDVGLPPAAEHVTASKRLSWEVLADGTVHASTWSPGGAEGSKGIERARLTIPPRSSGQTVGLFIFKGATARHLYILADLAASIGETTTAEALKAHAVARPDPVVNKYTA